MMVNAFSTALDQAAAIAAREVSAQELARLYLDRIARFNGSLNAFWITTPELAEAAAAAADRHQRSTALGGVTASVKDLTPMKGYPHTLGSRAYAGQVADVDAFAVTRMMQEGCVILGKTTTAEFGGRPVTDYGLHGAARNPWDLATNAGGSSGGAAAAVAAGLCAISHGSDGGGSVRIPAACCGVVGLKPSRGLISMGPQYGHGWQGLLTDGVLARSVADVAAGLDAMVGHLPGDPYWTDADPSYLDASSAPSRRLRVAFTKAAGVVVDPEVARAVDDVAASCEGLGHVVEETGPDTQPFRDWEKTIFAAAIGSVPVEDPGLLDPVNALVHEFARGLTASDLVLAVDAMHRYSRSVVAFWDEYDVLLTPTFTRPAPGVGELGSDPASAGDDHLDWLSFAYPYNCTGQPSISLPMGRSRAGLPIGVQLVGPPRGDSLILRLAVELEGAQQATVGVPPGWE
ncbi:amidase [Leekyejoonella antrihumi]|uniref:Amidase n=1 Tax=Leekyejoonella antrihumi TaxID=1660198 RepID=A0A563DPB6_9MICO|nr:amidase [Leekyejoonella antrihumi]TWP32045.1 amidase [Leekyejoonella antrihumi]